MVLRNRPGKLGGKLQLGCAHGPRTASGSDSHFQRAERPNAQPASTYSREYLQTAAKRKVEAGERLSTRAKDDVQLIHVGVLLLPRSSTRRAARTGKANALKPETFEILHNLGQTYLRAASLASGVGLESWRCT